MKQVSFAATILYGVITLLSLFIASLFMKTTGGIVASILAMAFSYASQSFYTHAFDKSHLVKFGHAFMALAILSGLIAGIFILV